MKSMRVEHMDDSLHQRFCAFFKLGNLQDSSLPVKCPGMKSLAKQYQAFDMFLFFLWIQDKGRLGMVVGHFMGFGKVIRNPSGFVAAD